MAASHKTLPAAPEWKSGNRIGERRASLTIAVNGRLSDFSIMLIVRLVDSAYLIALILAGDRCISRLCMGAGHFDRATLTFCSEPHFHAWSANRPKGPALPKELRNYVVLPREAWSRDGGFAWFLEQNGIESPAWMPPQWPENQGFV